jgi:hypothetical protein
MLTKIILVFLLAMVLVGMVGKVLFPDRFSLKRRPTAGRCPSCGRPRIGKTCDCKGGKA